MSFIGLFLIMSLNESSITTERKSLVKQVYEGVFWGAVEETQKNAGQIHLTKSSDKFGSIC